MAETSNSGPMPDEMLRADLEAKAWELLGELGIMYPSALPFVVAALRSARSEAFEEAARFAVLESFLREHGETLVRVCDMASRSPGFAKDFGGTDNIERAGCEALAALMKEIARG